MQTRLVDGNIFHDGDNDESWAVGTSLTVADGDIMMGALDMDNGKFWIGKNGTWWNNNSGTADPANGTAAAITASIINGARIIRVHDVLETYQAIKVYNNILCSR